jgi:hypothetical protein
MIGTDNESQNKTATFLAVKNASVTTLQEDTSTNGMV